MHLGSIARFHTPYIAGRRWCSVRAGSHQYHDLAPANLLGSPWHCTDIAMDRQLSHVLELHWEQPYSQTV
jgi:hypothetical protein